MSNAITGVIHGRMIELVTDPGLSDGLEVEVILRPRSQIDQPEPPAPGGRPTAAGMLSAFDDSDESLQEIIRERKTSTYREIPE